MHWLLTACSKEHSNGSVPATLGIKEDDD